jgi:hypothetical protein
MWPHMWLCLRVQFILIPRPCKNDHSLLVGQHTRLHTVSIQSLVSTNTPSSWPSQSLSYIHQLIAYYNWLSQSPAKFGWCRAFGHELGTLRNGLLFYVDNNWREHIALVSCVSIHILEHFWLLSPSIANPIASGHISAMEAARCTAENLMPRYQFRIDVLRCESESGWHRIANTTSLRSNLD